MFSSNLSELKLLAVQRDDCTSEKAGSGWLPLVPGLCCLATVIIMIVINDHRDDDTDDYCDEVLILGRGKFWLQPGPLQLHLSIPHRLLERGFYKWM